MFSMCMAHIRMSVCNIHIICMHISNVCVCILYDPVWPIYMVICGICTYICNVSMCGHICICQGTWFNEHGCVFVICMYKFNVCIYVYVYMVICMYMHEWMYVYICNVFMYVYFRDIFMFSRCIALGCMFVIYT